jgi:putative alpha-1,2-mannosidase
MSVIPPVKTKRFLQGLGISFTGIEGARNNLRAELDHWDFDAVRKMPGTYGTGS